LTAVPAATWTVDPIHSTANFAVKHMVVSTFRGTFTQVDATLVTGEQGYELRGSVPVDSVDSKLEDLKGHLLSPDFFDAANTPEITFTSTRFDVAEDGTAEIEGDLTIKGHTERVQATGNLDYIEADMSGGERIGVELQTVVDRTKYGLNWNAPLPKGGFALANDVKLEIHLELTKAEA
jgi:polyisoprenoid-binding protein YceI